MVFIDCDLRWFTFWFWVCWWWFYLFLFLNVVDEVWFVWFFCEIWLWLLYLLFTCCAWDCRVGVWSCLLIVVTVLFICLCFVDLFCYVLIKLVFVDCGLGGVLFDLDLLVLLVLNFGFAVVLFCLFVWVDCFVAMVRLLAGLLFVLFECVYAFCLVAEIV